MTKAGAERTGQITISSSIVDKLQFTMMIVACLILLLVFFVLFPFYNCSANYEEASQRSLFIVIVLDFIPILGFVASLVRYEEGIDWIYLLSITIVPMIIIFLLVYIRFTPRLETLYSEVDMYDQVV